MKQQVYVIWLPLMLRSWRWSIHTGDDRSIYPFSDHDKVLFVLRNDDVFFRHLPLWQLMKKSPSSTRFVPFGVKATASPMVVKSPLPSLATVTEPFTGILSQTSSSRFLPLWSPPIVGSTVYEETQLTSIDFTVS